MRKLLVTGAAGFIGSHLVEACVEAGYDVRAFVHYRSQNDWGWLERSHVRDAVEFVAGDIRDQDVVLDSMRGCDSVFHLAALIGIPYSYVSPLAYIRTNIEGTYNVLQSARSLDVERVLVTSTSETYGSAQYVPMDEKHPAVGQSPYAASKIGADQLATSYARSFQLPVTIVRPFNTYGPRQSTRAVVPTIITQILNGQEKISMGSVSPTRDLTFVTDTASAFLEIAKTNAFVGEAVNVGQNQETAIGDLVNTIAAFMGRRVETVCDNKRLRPASGEVERLRCDNSKLLAHTSWKPRYSLEQGLAATIEWLGMHMEHYKPELYGV